MALTRDFKDTIIERVNRDAKFAQALLMDEMHDLNAKDKKVLKEIIRHELEARQ